MHARVALIALVALAACRTPPPTHRYRVLVVAQTDAGVPLPGVAIEANGRALGATGPGGGLEVDLRAPEGKLLRIATACPPGWRAAEPVHELRLRRIAADDGRLTVTAECRPPERRAVVVVRTPGLAGVPILHRDREIGRTDRDGVAHLLLTMAPGTRFQLALDTSAHPRLRPRNPTQAFVVEDADALLTFDYQPIADKPAPRKRKKRRAAEPTGPIRIESVTAPKRRRG